VALLDRPLTSEEARAIAAWSYEQPFDLDDLSADHAVVRLTARDSDGRGYYPVEVGGEIAGFVCFGPEGRVAGQEPESGTVDVGAGLDPDRVGQGLATALMPEVVRFTTERFGAARLRAGAAAAGQTRAARRGAAP
jgi:RimJ/RimL family protein N-acetyltransferase